jgi:hypothetical protein
MENMHSMYSLADERSKSLSRMVSWLLDSSICIEVNSPREAAIREYSVFGGEDLTPHGRGT